MILGEIVRVWRSEGVRGLWVRLRYRAPTDGRSPTGGSPALTPVVTAPFRLHAPSSGLAHPDLAPEVATALRRVLGPDALSEAPGATAIHLAPAPEGDDFGPEDVVLFDRSAAADAFLTAGRARRDLGACAAILLPSADCLPPFLRAGIGAGRLFVLPSLAPGAPPATSGLAGDLARWLIAASALPPDRVDPALFPALTGMQPGSRLCLSLPESPERRQGFLKLGLRDVQVFDGIRRQPGWQGCGWSYATIARAALSADAAPLLVCEDDMIPGAAFDQRLAQVEAYLAGTEWDVFSGLLSNLPETCRIDRVEQRGDLTFVHLDYVIGAVFNIYGRRALQRLADWTPRDGRPATDTVDVWLSQMPGLRVITTLPFLTDHDPGATSTIFGFSNRRYDSMIRASERRLKRLVANHLNASRSTS